MPEGTEVEVPMWLALPLAARGIVSLKPPAYFGPSFQAHLLADASVLNINEKSPYYYELGVRLSMLMRQKRLPAILKKAFHARYLGIIDTSTNLGNVDTSDHIRKLTTTERALFHLGHAAAAEVVHYKSRNIDRLQAAPIVSRKRRRSALR